MLSMWLQSLCTSCLFLRTTKNERGSIFYLCGKNKSDSRFSKYPVQPVTHCTGYNAKNFTENKPNDEA